MCIGAALNVGSDCRFYGRVAIARDLLKLVYRNQARLVCLVEIGKDFIQGDGRIVYSTKAHAPHRRSVHIKGDFRAQRGHYIDKLFPSLPAFRP